MDFFRDILMAAATQAGGAAAGPSYGPELIDNPDFASAADWTLGGVGASISTGKLRFTGAAVGQASSDGTESTMTEGITYHVVYTIDTISVGTVVAFAGDGVGTIRTTAGTYTQDILCGFIEEFGFSLSSNLSDAVIDNVSVKQVL